MISMELGNLSRESAKKKLTINNLDQDLEEIIQSPECVRKIASLSKGIIELASNKNELDVRKRTKAKRTLEKRSFS